jgi:glycosyltransferase involved in cell wall biosynthesis
LSALAQGVRTRVDVVDGSNLVVFPVAWLIAKLRRRPIVFWYPDVLIGQWRSGDFGMTGRLGEAIERFVLRLPVDRYIAISESTARKLVAHGVKPARITVIPCGYEPATVAAAALAGVNRSYPPTITVVGRLVPYKRVDVVIRALADLRDAHPDLRLEIIGQGPELPRLRRLAIELGVADRVAFSGHVDAHVDVLRRVAASRLFVSASEIEGFGIVVVEAMALGVPYVVADNEAFTEITGAGTGGALFRRGDHVDLAAQIDGLLSDDDRATAAADAGREFARRYQWHDVADATERVYAELVATRRSSPPRARQGSHLASGQ